MFDNPVTLVPYAISALGAQIGLVLLLIGKNNPKTKRLGYRMTVVFGILHFLFFILNFL